MSLSLLGYMPEEYIDFKINIGLIPQDERKKRIDELYKGASKILADMLYDGNK